VQWGHAHLAAPQGHKVVPMCQLILQHKLREVGLVVTGVGVRAWPGEERMGAGVRHCIAENPRSLR
jgi:hypothetical protein